MVGLKRIGRNKQGTSPWKRRNKERALPQINGRLIDFRISCEKNRRLTLYCMCLPPIFVFLLN